jgi:hypothetical protein
MHFIFLVLVKMVVSYVTQFLVSNNAHTLTGHHLVHVHLHAMVHKLVIKLWKDLTVIEPIHKMKLVHVVQQQQLIQKVAQHVHVWIQRQNNVLLIALLQMTHVPKLKIHYLHILMHHQQMVHVVVHALKFLVNIFIKEKEQINVNLFFNRTRNLFS